jgi:hypothetical protein
MALLQTLRQLHRRLVVLGPPMPVTEEQKDRWIPEENAPLKFPAPVLELWDPPPWVPRRKGGGFWLAQNAVCFQRGYAPRGLYQDYMQASATCFGGTPAEEEASLQLMTYDFFVAIVATTPTTNERAVSGCVVELRPAANTTQAACLYISTLCTDPTYGGKGLAHQLVHAVYTLGTLLLEQNREAAKGAWRNAIPSQQLFVALNVLRHPDEPKKHERLIRMYSQCGLTTRDRVPHTEFLPFTALIVYEWQYDANPQHMIPMWQDVSVAVLYEDDQVRILRPEKTDAAEKGRTVFFHAFPEAHITAVQSHGIVSARHACLFPKTEPVYFAKATTNFTRAPPPEGACFCIQAEHKTKGGEDILLRISVPSWFACAIEPAAQIRRLYMH